MDVRVKQEIKGTLNAHMPKRKRLLRKLPDSVIELGSSSSELDLSDLDDPEENVDANDAAEGGTVSKKRNLGGVDFVMPAGFLASLPPEGRASVHMDSDMEVAEVPQTESEQVATMSSGSLCKQFWKAGDYDGTPSDWDLSTGGMDRVRVHPKFLHSNATSHKWALGAFAELLDNSMDEICNGATYVTIDIVKNKKDGSSMLLIEDNGGGMDPDKMRQCMSLGYSAKSKMANTIGQYGNGFKTSTMRLGADVIVFSRCGGKDGKCPTRSIGLLSYTFLTSTGKEDIVVPMLDYVCQQGKWGKMIRSTASDWDRNVETVVQWSPFSSEADLLSQFHLMEDHGTRIIIYNLWEDDQGLLELDFHSDQYDIQLRGVNRDENNIQMAKEYPNSRHFLTYKHSLRSYASILYLRLCPKFRIILRGKDVEHHNIVNDMMMSEMIAYRPNPSAEGAPKNLNMLATVTVGFVKDADHHIDVQGFNVYHKNRLIKPFWRVWNAAGSDGRGVIGVLEANFVEPAHDKQGFERTTVLSRLETRLKEMQKNYWFTNCHHIGYAPRRNKKIVEQSLDRDTSPDRNPQKSVKSNKSRTSSGKKRSSDTCKLNSQSNQKKGGISDSCKLNSQSNQEKRGKESQEFPEILDGGYENGHVLSKGDKWKNARKETGTKGITKSGKRSSSVEPSFPSKEDVCEILPEKQVNGSSQKIVTRSHLRERSLNDIEASVSATNLLAKEQLIRENSEIEKRLEKYEAVQSELQQERDRCESLETTLNAALAKIEELNIEQENLINIFSEERGRRDQEEETLRKKLKDASNTIQQLLDKIKVLENRR